MKCARITDLLHIFGYENDVTNANAQLVNDEKSISDESCRGRDPLKCWRSLLQR